MENGAGPSPSEGGVKIEGERNPFQFKSRRFVYENAWIRVREDQVIRPDGKDGIYGVVEFKNRAIGIVALTEEKETYLVGQYRYPLDAYSWEIPEGGGPLQEAPLLAAKRELLEETGLTASRWTDLGISHLSNSVSNEVAQMFLAEGLSQGVSDPEGTEVLQIKKLPFDEAWRMAMSGEITDSLSILGLARAKHFIEEARKER